MRFRFGSRLDLDLPVYSQGETLPIQHIPSFIPAVSPRTSERSDRPTERRTQSSESHRSVRSGRAPSGRGVFLTAQSSGRGLLGTWPGWLLYDLHLSECVGFGFGFEVSLSSVKFNAWDLPAPSPAAAPCRAVLRHRPVHPTRLRSRSRRTKRPWMRSTWWRSDFGFFQT